jgi:hypothetical protein
MRIGFYIAARRMSLSDPDETSSLVGGNGEQDLDIQFLTYSSIDLRKRSVSSTDDGVFWMFDAGSDQPSNSLQDRLHKEGVIIASRKKGPDNAVQTAAMYRCTTVTDNFLSLWPAWRKHLGFVSSKQHT